LSVSDIKVEMPWSVVKAKQAGAGAAFTSHVAAINLLRKCSKRRV